MSNYPLDSFKILEEAQTCLNLIKQFKINNISLNFAISSYLRLQDNGDEPTYDICFPNNPDIRCSFSEYHARDFQVDVTTSFDDFFYTSLSPVRTTDREQFNQLKHSVSAIEFITHNYNSDGYYSKDEIIGYFIGCFYHQMLNGIISYYGAKLRELNSSSDYSIKLPESIIYNMYLTTDYYESSNC